ncbi:MAG: hypothetical protein ACFB21_12300 [Opitutales bacterium]
MLQRSNRHVRDAKFYDPQSIRQAIRQGECREVYFRARQIYDIADRAMERRIPPGRSESEARKHAAIKGILNLPTPIQRLVQSLPEEFWVREQAAFVQSVADWLQETFGSDFVGMVALHTDKVRLHVEWLALKYGEDRRLLPAFVGFRHDGGGVSGCRTTAAISGKKFPESEQSKWKFNTVAEMRLALEARGRILAYLREMGRAERRRTMVRAREVGAHLEATLSSRSKDRRTKTRDLEPVRAEYKQLLKTHRRPPRLMSAKPKPHEREKNPATQRSRTQEQAEIDRIFSLAGKIPEEDLQAMIAEHHRRWIVQPASPPSPDIRDVRQRRDQGPSI